MGHRLGPGAGDRLRGEAGDGVVALEESVRVVCDSEVLSDLLVQAIRAPTLEAFEALLREWPGDAEGAG